MDAYLFGGNRLLEVAFLLNFERQLTDPVIAGRISQFAIRPLNVLVKFVVKTTNCEQ